MREGLLIEGLWIPEDVDHKYAVPVALICTARAGPRPALVVRYPAAQLNALLKQDLVGKMVREKEYVFGHYDLAQQWKFDSATVRSTNGHGAGNAGR